MPILSDDRLVSQFEEHQRISENGNAKQHRKDKQNYAFHHGNEASYRTTINDRGRRRNVIFNKVKPFIDAVTGIAIQLRRRPEYIAMIADNELQLQYSTSMTSSSNYFRARANMDQIETRQDRAMFIAGWGAKDTDISYEINPDGDVASMTIPYDSYFWDPQSLEPCLIDRRWDYWKKVYNRKEAVKRFKGTKPDDFETAQETNTKDFVWNPDGGSYDKISESDWISYTSEDLVNVYKYQYYTLEPYWRCRNPLYDIQNPDLFREVARLIVTMKNTRAENVDEDYADDINEFDPSDEWLTMTPLVKDDMEVLFEKFGFDVDYQQFLKKCFYTAIISKKAVLKKYKSPHQRGFTTDVKTGSFDPDRKLWYGLVDSLKEPAKYSNKALTEMLYVIAANSKGGVMYETSAIDDKNRFEQQWARTDGSVEVNDGALSGGKIQPKAKAALPNGYEGIYEISESSLSEVSGLPKEILGLSDTADPTGVLEAQRVNKVVSTLADYFDSISLSQLENARLMETYIRILAENSEGRLIAVMGEDGAKQYMALSQDKLADQYDIEIGEAPTSPAQKNLTQNIMTNLANTLLPTGTNIWGIAVDYLPIKQSDKQKLKQAMAPNPQQQQAQQQMAMKKFMDESNLNAAITEAQKANAQKDMSSAALNIAKIPSAHADADKTTQDALHTNIENNILRTIPHSDINIKV